ncbi:UNVERIFIED_CONTAM: hypothetical protein GTU68_060625 [Idotea baltica]|nr:hypothetical protein [Idotea baltica]
MYSINGRDICSGALVNNVRNDCTPYFLTAKHCEVTANNAASVVVYWNYQQTTCRTPGSATSGGIGDGPRNMFNSGIQLLSEFDNSDMALFLLDDPVAPEVDAYFAGWDATGAILDSAICVHHPQAEEKRISFDYEPSVPFFSNQFYRVLDWNEGTTESGSSGAPLFSTDRLIVGQLNGGAASCGNEEYDDFGMVAISWEGGGTPETSLKSWLDPDNTGTLTHGGRSCSDLITVAEPNIQFCTLQSTTAQTTISIQSGYEAGADLSIKSIPSNVSLTFSQGSISPTSPNATVTIELENGYDETSGEIIIAINSNNVEDLLNINFLVDLDVPDAPIPTFPEDGASNVSYDIDLLWEGTALSYQIEIYEVLEQGNQDLVLSETLASREFPIRDLKNNTTYNWRVQGLNSCGEGAFSDYFSFVTGDVSCNLLNDGDLPQSIGTELDTIHSVITVEEVGAVVDVNVLNVRGTHTFVSDLIMEIRSPNGTVVELLSYKCQDADNFSLSFDDDSDIINTPCPLISQNPQRPAGSLSDFTGESAQGEWVLTIYDDVREDGGSFDSWSLEICVLAEDVVERSISILPALVEVCEKTQEGPIEIAGTISGGYGNSVVIEAIGPITDDISITPNPVTGSGSRTFAISIDNIENLPLGSFIQLLASDEMGVDTISIAVAEMETPDMPSLLSPANNLIGEDLKPSFSWNSAALTNSYRVKVGSDETLTNPVLDTVLEGTSVTFSKKLAVDTEYFWSVTAEGTCTNVESEIFMFRTTLIDATRDISLQAIKIYPNPLISNFCRLAVPNHLRIGNCNTR